MEVDLGGVVFVYHVGVDDSRRCGAAGYQRRARFAGRVQDGGAVWCLGDIDGRHGKVNAMIPLGDGSRKTAVAISAVCAMACIESLLGFLDVCVGVLFGHFGHVLGQPLHHSVGSASCR